VCIEHVRSFGLCFFILLHQCLRNSCKTDCFAGNFPLDPLLWSCLHNTSACLPALNFVLPKRIQRAGLTLFINMRRTVLLALIINILVVALLLKVLWPLLSLLVLNGSSDAISRAELPAPGSSSLDAIPPLIPKIIHQTWKNATIPEKWQEAQKSCLDIHADYEYKVSQHLYGVKVRH